MLRGLSCIAGAALPARFLLLVLVVLVPVQHGALGVLRALGPVHVHAFGHDHDHGHVHGLLHGLPHGQLHDHDHDHDHDNDNEHEHEHVHVLSHGHADDHDHGHGRLHDHGPARHHHGPGADAIGLDDHEALIDGAQDEDASPSAGAASGAALLGAAVTTVPTGPSGAPPDTRVAVLAARGPARIDRPPIGG